MATEAWVTLCTNDSYALGCLVVGHSLRRAKTTRSLCVMITRGVSENLKSQLSTVFDNVVLVDVLDSKDELNLALIQRPDLGITFTKLQCWRLTQYTKCVFMDADTLVVQNCDELFDREELTAAPDVGWPDCFNSGVFVFQPSDETYRALLQLALQVGSFDGGDQGLLNVFFKDWYSKDIRFRLPFIYNMSSSAIYSYKAAFKYFGNDVKIVHFLGAVKPWNYVYDPQANSVVPRGDANYPVPHLQLWWQIFATCVLGAGEVASQLAHLTIVSAGGVGPSGQYDSRQHQRAWEEGRIDYKGVDSWAHIQERLEQTLQGQAARSPTKDTVPKHFGDASKQ